MIAPMSRVEIVMLSSVRAKMVERLQELGLLHMEEVPLAVEEAPTFLNRVHLEGEEHAALVRLEELDRTLGEIVPLLSESPAPAAVKAAENTAAALEESAWGERVDGWAAPLREATRNKASLQDNLDVLENYRHVLEQVAPVLGGSNVKLGKGTRAIVLSGNVDLVAGRLDERFSEALGAECDFHKNKISRKRLVGLISFPEEKSDAVSRILSQEGIAPVDMPDEDYAEATAGEILSRIDEAMAKHRSEIAALEGELKKIASAEGASIHALKNVLRDRLSQLHVQNQFAQSQMVTVVNAWTPKDRYAELERVVENEFPGQATVSAIGHDDIPYAQVPTLLQNPKVFKPFEVLLKLFKPPAYGTIDPTIMVAVSFILFYGFIVGDVGYGIVIIACAMALGRKWGHIEAVRSAGIIGVYMGLSTMVFGVLYGEYFGDILGIHYVWFHRGHDTGRLLVYSLYIGIFHILLSLGLGVREHFRHGHTAHAFERLGMLLGLLGLIIIAFGYFEVGIFASTPMFALAIAMLVVGSIMIVRALGPMMGAVGVVEIMSLGGNVISYARLMALGVAAIAIADIANGLPESLGPVIGIPMAIMIHLANIFISMASPTIHSLRLNFVEFLPKFYAPEGKGFTPFKKETMS